MRAGMDTSKAGSIVASVKCGWTYTFWRVGRCMSDGCYSIGMIVPLVAVGNVCVCVVTLKTYVYM